MLHCMTVRQSDSTHSATGKVHMLHCSAAQQGLQTGDPARLIL